jgi:hypothetical protein
MVESYSMSLPEEGIPGQPNGEGIPQHDLTPQSPRQPERAQPKKKVGRLNQPERTRDKRDLTKQEQKWLHLLDEEALALPPLPEDFERNVLARLGIPSAILSNEPPSPEAKKAEAEETARLIFSVGKTPIKP